MRRLDYNFILPFCSTREMKRSLIRTKEPIIQALMEGGVTTYDLESEVSIVGGLRALALESSRLPKTQTVKELIDFVVCKAIKLEKDFNR